MSQFRETPYNVDCIHHTMGFLSKVDRCPYCNEPALWVIGLRIQRWISGVIFLGIVGWLLYLTLR